MQDVAYYLCKKLGSFKRSLDILEERRQNAETSTQIENCENEIEAVTLIRNFVLNTLKEIKTNEKNV